MTQIKKVKTSEGVQFYPQTHTKAVIDDNGVDLETTLNIYTKQSYIDGDYYSE